MEKEEWRKIVDTVYSISNLGRVRRETTGKGTAIGRILKCTVHHSGYLTVSLALGARRNCVRPLVHILVARVFLGSPPKGLEVNHIDGNKTNARLDNLEYVTRSENKKKAIEMGLVVMPRGVLHYKAKLTERDIVQIRRWNLEGVNQHEIGRRLGVKQVTIWRILHGISWKHV